MTTTDKRGFRVRALGEIAIRCTDFDAMVAFYSRIIGLDRLEGNTSPDITFFRIAEGYGGHITVLALFRAPPGSAAAGPTSSLHHLALTIAADEQEAAMRWYERNGIAYRVEEFGWVGWRGVFTEDPEGNTVELVAYHPDLTAP